MGAFPFSRGAGCSASPYTRPVRSRAAGGFRGSAGGRQSLGRPSNAARAGSARAVVRGDDPGQRGTSPSPPPWPNWPSEWTSSPRTDRAGNMSKRQSATGFHFSRAGGTCPLWNVHEAFAAPAASTSRSPKCPTDSATCGPPARSPGTAAAGASPARPSPSAWAARSATPTASSTPTVSTSPGPPPPPPSAWAAASANAWTVPSAAHRRSAGPLRIDQNTSTFVPYPVTDRTV